MRARTWLLLLLVAAPMAAAQSEPEPARPSLTVSPLVREASPGAQVEARLAVHNPLARDLDLALRIVPSDGVKARADVTRLHVPAGADAVAILTILLPSATNVTHTVSIVAEEAAGPNATTPDPSTVVLRERLTIRVPPPPNARPPIELRVEPASLRAPFDGFTTAKLLVRNDGDAILAPRFETIAQGYTVVVAPRDVIPARSTTEIAVTVRALRDAPTYDALGTIHLVGHRATVRFALSHEPLALSSREAVAAEPASVSGLLDAVPRETLAVTAVATGVAGAWTGLWLTRRSWWPLLLALYTRLRPSKMLDHPLRRRIADTVRERPGISFSELARAVDIAPGQLTHHARMLEKAGIVFSSPDGQTRRFFHVGAGRLPPVLPLAERALSMLRERPRHASELARDLGVSRQALHYHVKQLVAEGKLLARPEGREMWLEPAPQPSSPTARLARS